MNKAVGQYLKAGPRQRIYLILVSVSLLLFSCSIWEITPVIVQVDDPVGLVSHLTPAYWAGLAVLLLVSSLAFLDRELKSDFTLILILLTLGLFLVGIVVFVYASTRNPDVYYPNSEAYRLVAEGRFDIGALPLGAQYEWPGLTLINAAILTTTGISGDFIQGFVKYMPLLWILLFVFITYGAGKRLELAPRWCFLLSFLPLTSWWELNYYRTASVAVLLYLLLFMLVLRPKRTVGDSVAAILIFGGLVLTHGFHSIVLLPALVMLSIYRRENRLIALFIVLFGAWYLYQATTAVDQGVYQTLTGPFWRIQEVARAERYAMPSAAGREFARYTQLGYVILYIALLTGSALLLVRGKIIGERRKLAIASFFWVVGVASLIATGIASELLRFYILFLVPMAVIIALSFAGLRHQLATALMIPVMCLVVALHLPAAYSCEAAWIQVPTTELKGSQFFVDKVNPQHGEYYFSNNPTFKVLLGFDPYMIESDPIHVSVLPPWPRIDFSEINDRAAYVIIGRAGMNAELFSFGELTYSGWPQTEVGKRADLLYDSGDFEIYSNQSR